MHKRRREELFNLFSANGKAHITLSEAISGISTALTQAHGKQAVVIYRRYYRCYKWAFHDARDQAALGGGRSSAVDHISQREFRLLLLHLCVYATWYEVFAHTIIVSHSTPGGRPAPSIPRRQDPSEYWSELDHKFIRPEWSAAVGKVREAGRTWAPYLSLMDATVDDFDEMAAFADNDQIDFRAFCAWIHAAERAAGSAIGVELVGPREESIVRRARFSPWGSPPRRLALDSFEDLRPSYLDEGPWSGTTHRTAPRLTRRGTGSFSGSTLGSPPRRVSEAW